MGTIRLCWPDVGLTVPIWRTLKVKIDGRRVNGVKSGQSSTYQVPIGSHTIKVGIDFSTSQLLTVFVDDGVTIEMYATGPFLTGPKLRQLFDFLSTGGGKRLAQPRWVLSTASDRPPTPPKPEPLSVRQMAAAYLVVCGIAFIAGAALTSATQGAANAALAALLITIMGLITDWTFSTSSGQKSN